MRLNAQTVTSRRVRTPASFAVSADGDGVVLAAEAERVREAHIDAAASFIAGLVGNVIEVAARIGF
jgi:hypothetical protein